MKSLKVDDKEVSSRLEQKGSKAQRGGRRLKGHIIETKHFMISDLGEIKGEK